MRPLRMTIQAFGPFAGMESIDFTGLPQRAPFTISGPTGAGKTAILDAMCVALFGKTSGGERQASEMRSQHAGKDLPTEVTLEFSLRGQVWQVVRRPPSADVSQSAKLLKQLAPGEWQVDSQRLTEVNDKIGALLGFSVEQFRQVVVLPQGAFRQLLSAGSKDREDILKQLFATQLYERIQDELKGRESGLRKDTEKIGVERKTLLGQHGVDDGDKLADLEAGVTTAKSAATVSAKVAAEARAAADAALNAGNTDAALLRDADDFAKAAADHEQGRPQQLAREATIAAAERAERAVPANQLAEKAAQQAAKAKQAALDAKGDYDKAVPKADAAQEELHKQRAKAPERDALTSEAKSLEGLRDKVAALDAAQTEAGKTEQEWQTAKQARDDNSKAISDLQSQLPKRQSEVEALRQTAATADGAKARVDKLQRVRKLAAAAQAERVKHTELARQHGEALEAHGLAVQAEATQLGAYNQCHQAWVSGQAARLATTLQAGEPCAVCGSREHPQPATGGGSLPTDGELEQAKAAYDKARTLTGERDAAAKTLAARVDAAVDSQRQADETLAEEALDPALADDAALAATQAAVKAAEAAAAKVVDAAKQVAAAEGSLAQLRDASTGAEEAVSRAAAAAAIAAERAGSLLAEVPEALRSPAALAKEIAAKHEAARSMQAALDAAQRAATVAGEACAGLLARLQAADLAAGEAAVEADKCARELDTALLQHDFASHADWVAARLSAEDLAQRQQDAQKWRDTLTALTAKAAQAAERAAAVVPPDLPALTAAAKDAQDADSAAQQEVATLRQKLDQLQKTMRALAELAAQAGDLEAQYVVVKELAATCTGSNPKNLALQRFVLAGLLDDVLGAANVRLATMTRGRYALQRIGTLADKRKVGGLDLEVADAYTGQQRPATTLSGGEGFMASLALALGLSDVVQGYSGGIRLDALFIDEGFGTLDPEALDLAINALIELSNSKDTEGRLVGVISHVPELKARLARGIEVVVSADGRGSSVRVAG